MQLNEGFCCNNIDKQHNHVSRLKCLAFRLSQVKSCSALVVQGSESTKVPGRKTFHAISPPYQPDLVSYSQIGQTDPYLLQIQHFIHLFLFQDVLNNERMKLDWMFKMSFASDIARVRAGKIFVRLIQQKKTKQNKYKRNNKTLKNLPLVQIFFNRNEGISSFGILICDVEIEK